MSGFDDRHAVGYVLHTGTDVARADPDAVAVVHDGDTVRATRELAATLRDALAHRPTASLGWSGPTVPLTLDDATLLAWLRHDVGGVLTVQGDPGPHPALRDE